ncbi:MAG: hypothetical protein M1812_001984 [Candelaria pacifica]|nr:MAG: hypothetical protein M1812_001984 [Candelaria pacifica]
MLSFGVASTLFFHVVVASNATKSSHMTGWTAEPNTRGTIGLLWSCLSTLLICTWTIQHLNIPAEEDSKWYIFFRKLKWTIISLIAPEILAGGAITEHINVHRQVKHWNQTVVNSSDEYWTMSHGFFVASGGLLVTIPSVTNTSDPVDTSTHHRSLLQYSGKEARLHLVSLEGASNLIEERLIRPSDLSIDTIQDRSKASDLAKGLACFQSGWLVLQCIGRKTQDLPISVLELSCLAYVGLTFVIYGLWWDRPVDVRTPTTVSIPLEPSRWSERQAFELRSPSSRTKNLSQTGDSNVGIYACFFAAIPFGAWHTIAWNLVFPTAVEQILWRVASISSIALPVAFPFTFAILSRLYDNEVLHDIILDGLILAYIVIRMYMIAEMFASLRSMPAGVYQTVKWAEYFPHL